MIFKGEGTARVVTGKLIKNAKYQKVGEKKYPKTEIAIAFGKGDNEIINAAFWYESATAAAKLVKNDRVLVAGNLTSRDYEGKTYWTLDADFFAVQPVRTEEQEIAEGMAGFTEVKTDEPPFPF